MDDNIDTYPFLLVHGFASRDFSIDDSPLWGRIPARLRGFGARVWFGNQDAVGSVRGNAAQLSETITQVLAATGASKVHVIAHSKGGLDVRGAFTLKGTAAKVASVATLASPHRGTRYCDALARSKLVVPHVVAPLANMRARAAGDANPCGMQLLHDLTTKGAGERAQSCPCMEGVPFQSFAFLPVSGHETMREKAARALVTRYDGENDGLVPLWSSDFAHSVVVRAHAANGVRFRHDDATDMHKADHLLQMPDGTEYCSIVDFVEGLARSLAVKTRRD